MMSDAHAPETLVPMAANEAATGLPAEEKKTEPAANPTSQPTSSA
jgi:hypothetical protein